MNSSFSQINFTFGNKLNYEVDDYIVSDANRKGFNFLRSWPHWGIHKFANSVFIHGPSKSGKTHLCRIWQNTVGAKFINDTKCCFEVTTTSRCFIIDDVECFVNDEEKLLRLINIINEEQKFLIVTSHVAPHMIGFTLPDLQSRVNAFTHIKINAPDDLLFKGLIFKYFSDRQLKVNLEVINYICTRVDRTYEAIHCFIEKADQVSLKEKRNITIPFIKELFNYD